MAQVSETLEIPEGWHLKNSQLVREVSTTSYMNAVELTLKIANLAEESNHHPDILLTYSGAKVSVTSHDVGKVTQRDVDFALASNVLIKQLS